MILDESGRVRAGALAEDQQVRKRIPPKPVRAVQAGGALSRREEAPGTLDICVSASTRTPPMM